MLRSGMGTHSGREDELTILRGIQTAEEEIVVAERAWEVARSHQYRVNEVHTCHTDTNIVSSK
jgi:hypothetical protein